MRYDAQEEMEGSKMEGMMNWFEHLPEDKKKAIMKAKLEMKIKKVQAVLLVCQESKEMICSV